MYDLISVIFNKLTKIVYYRLVKTIINIGSIAEIIIITIMRYYSDFNFIISKKGILSYQNFDCLHTIFWV